MRTNAKVELIELLLDKAPIKCATIQYNEETPIILKLNHSEAEKEIFMSKLDFEYYAGYGGQELYGLVWLEDNTWCERGEYDGSEWWEHHKLPDIPAELL
jgi:hypothetical protein